MSNPTQEYNEYIRANLPLGITYDDPQEALEWAGVTRIPMEDDLV